MRTNEQQELFVWTRVADATYFVNCSLFLRVQNMLKLNIVGEQHEFTETEITTWILIKEKDYIGLSERKTMPFVKNQTAMKLNRHIAYIKIDNYIKHSPLCRKKLMSLIENYTFTIPKLFTKCQTWQTVCWDLRVKIVFSFWK